MVEKKTFETITNTSIIVVLIVLAFFILKPILLSTIAGLLLAFIFYPLYKKISQKTKAKNLSAILLCISLIIIILLPLILVAPLIARQVFDIYIYLQRTDMITPLKEIFPYLFDSPELAQTISTALTSFVGKVASALLTSFTEILLNSVTITLHFLLILFVFFFGLRDGEQLVQLIKEISPLSKESEKRVFAQFKNITHSVIFGQIIIGLVQGLITGIGLFVFRVPNAMTLTLLATFLGILPIVGPVFVWVPVDIYLFLTGRTFAGVGLFIYGAFVITWVDTLIRPFIISSKSKIHPALALISMVGGLFVFGILGLILGPLIIAYLIMLLEFYKRQKPPRLWE